MQVLNHDSSTYTIGFWKNQCGVSCYLGVNAKQEMKQVKEARQLFEPVWKSAKCFYIYLQLFAALIHKKVNNLTQSFHLHTSVQATPHNQFFASLVVSTKFIDVIHVKIFGPYIIKFQDFCIPLIQFRAANQYFYLGLLSEAKEYANET